MVAALVVVSLGCAFGIYEANNASKDAKEASKNAQTALDNFKAEAKGRRDEQCVLFERSHLSDVQALRNTYAYLNTLSVEEAATPLNQFIIVRLPEVEDMARVDTAPEYCDEPGIGLPEPDPELPPIRDFSYLLQQSQR